MARISPIAAFGRGLLAGAVGSFAQDLFFTATAKLAPPPVPDAFDPPEVAQTVEQPTQTVARRVVEEFMYRGPLEDRERGGRIVHYVFGAAWGGLYGIVRGSTRSLRGPLGVLGGVLGFSTLVWVASDNVLLPAFRLAAWPQHYPARNHAYALAAHVVYGTAVWATFEALGVSAWAPALAAGAAWWGTRSLPAPLRAPVAEALTALRAQRPAQRLHAAVQALQP